MARQLPLLPARVEVLVGDLRRGRGHGRNLLARVRRWVRLLTRGAARPAAYTRPPHADLRVPLRERPPLRGDAEDHRRPGDECEVCGAPVQRVFHPVAVHFKGSGFYNTDYGTARRKRETASSAKEGADKHDAKQAEKKTEPSKPAPSSASD